MVMPKLIPLRIASDSAPNDALLGRQISEHWSFPISDDSPQTLYLEVVDGTLGLVDGEEKKVNPVVVDFASPASMYRKAHGGGKKEAIVKAIGLKGAEHWHVVDATPGLGRDAFVLVSVGCHVSMIERSPVVAALLEDGIRRLAIEYPELAERMTLHHGNSAEVMQYWKDGDVDAIYLDPMFPHRKKSALVKKEMRIFQHLLGHDPDADALLAPALSLANARVVVKRPNSASVLAEINPTMAIESKKHRFDVYLCNKN